MIKPTIGRIVWFTPPLDEVGAVLQGGFVYNHTVDQPCVGLVCRMWSERSVNLTVFDHNGNQHRFYSVQLLQDNDERPKLGFFAEWMPYQKGQAAKHDSLSKSEGEDPARDRTGVA